VADERRRTTRGSGPRAGTGPGRARAGGRGSTPPGGRPSTARAGGAGRPRPRFTGRAAILVLVLAVLTVSYASSLRAYLTQRAHLEDLRAQIEEKSANIEAYEREARRWDDDGYVAQQARERLDYVNPGETSYVVIGRDGEPLGGDDASLSEPVVAPPDEEVPPAWWDTAWDSVEAAGDPEAAAEEEAEQQPADEIVPPPEQTEEGTE
jgi:cell division protein FtsB